MEMNWLKSIIRFLVQISMIDEFCKDYIKFENRKIVMLGGKKYKLPFRIESKKLRLKIYFCYDINFLKKTDGISNNEKLKKYFFVAIDVNYLEWKKLLMQQGVPSEHIGFLPLFLTDKM